MKLSIFSRLVGGYLIIFLMVMAVSILMLFQFRHFNVMTRSILDVDNRIIENEKKLTDSLLSQIRYEKKYLIVRDDALYDQFLLAKIDFLQILRRSLALADQEEKSISLKKIQDSYRRYQSLFDEEVEYVRANRRYPQEWYRQEKEKSTTAIVEELRNLKAYSQKHTYDRIRALEEAMADARKMAGIFVGVVLFWGVMISLVVTRSITKPLAQVIHKTRDVSNGILEGDLRLFSPPEVGELSKAFNAMCERLKALERMKSDFFSMMSHELRTPLTSIKEGTNLLLEGVGGKTSTSQTKLLTIISEESTRLINLVNSLMDLSKMEAGMMAFNFAPDDIVPLVKKTATEIEPLAVAKSIILEVAPAEKLPLLRMDAERVLQALRNLIGNAVKFTPEGGRVTVSLTSADKNVVVRVTDTGPGIPGEHLTTIFEKFHQAQYHRMHNIKGTGLGLAIAKHIVTAHGGKIWAESVLGQGSSFIFSLPA